MATTRIAMSATEEAYLSHVMAGHAAAIRTADATKNEMVNVLLKDKGIPLGVQVTTEPRAGDAPAYLVFLAPEEATSRLHKTPAAAGRGKKK